MVQSILLFALGFLCAGFLSLMIAPAVWRRAVSLTRRRIEAAVPLSLNEIQADKDRLRAEFAMSTRRLEMTLKDVRERANAQVIELNRTREELKRLVAERDERRRSAADLEGQSAEVRAELGRRDDELASLAGKLEESGRALQERKREVERLGKLYEEASFQASSRQIELVARESEMEKLTGDVADLKAARKEADRRAREAAAETKVADDALREERARTAELERQLGQLATALAERDQKLELREKELSLLRGAPTDGQEEQRVSEQLREQMNQLAAEVLRLTAALDGPGSPIERALECAGLSDDEGVVSLADRVRALQKAAGSGRE